MEGNFKGGWRGGEGALRRDFETRRGQSLESSSSPPEEREGLLLMMKVAWRGIGGRWLIPPLETSVFPQYFRRMQGKFRQLVGNVKPGFSSIEIKKTSVLYRTKPSWRLIFIRKELTHEISRVSPLRLPPLPTYAPSHGHKRNAWSTVLHRPE